MEEKKIYTPKEFAEKIRVTVRTLRRWEVAKLLIPKRYPTGNRKYYTDEDLQSFLNPNGANGGNSDVSQKAN